MTILRTVSVLALLCVLAACGDGAKDSPQGRSGTAAVDPAGVTYLVTSASDGGEPHELVAGPQILLAFDQHRLVITAGCNTMSGGYAVDGPKLTVAPLASTEMACSPDLMDQDQWLASIFAEPVLLTAGDKPREARITADDVVLNLIEQAAAGAHPALEGTHWELDSIKKASSVSSIPDGAEAWIEFNDGSVIYRDGCNEGGGKARTTATTITFSDLAGSSEQCAGVEDVQQAFATVINGRTTYEIRDGALWIYKGEDGLAFLARQ